MRYPLAKHEIHVWHADLDAHERHVEQYLSSLSSAERDRAQRFHFQRDRCRFIVRRGILRSLLADYTQSKPADLQFETNEYGKPALVQRAAPTVQFNTSHSNGRALVAVSLDQSLGVDIEAFRSNIDYWDLAQRFFARDEIASLGKLAPSHRLAAFFRVWTRKEAYIKAIGMGVSFPLDRFAVTAEPNRPALLWSDRSPDDAWHFHEIDAGHESAAVVVVSGETTPPLSIQLP